jgi:hypothetical protein
MVPNQAYIDHRGFQPLLHPGIGYAYNFSWPAPQQGLFAGPINMPQVAPQPNGTGVIGWNPRMAQPFPRIDATMPAAQLSNSTGGTGCEPGYNYFFPAEHTKIHVFTTSTPPWQLPSGAAISFKATHVPCNTTLGELLKGFGCNNAFSKKNRCFEIVQGGNGRWYKGLSFSGDDKDRLAKTVKEVGWDATRNGLPGGKPVVCLWLTKD